MAFLDDFKKFALKGNVVDLAVAVIIGASFGKIVSALVADIVMPLVALVLPSGDWRNSNVLLRAGAIPKDNVELKWGDFLGTIVDFLVVALVLFIIVARIVKVAEERLGGVKPAETKECPRCFETINIRATRCKACTADLVVADA